MAASRAGLLADARGMGVGGAGARRGLVGARVGAAEEAVAQADIAANVIVAGRSR